MSVNEAFRAFVADLASDGALPDPLAADFNLGLLWHDLALLAGETPPAEVATLPDAPAASFLAPHPALLHGGAPIVREPYFDPA